MLDILRYNLIEYGINTEYFHCAYDNKHVRKNIFSLISKFSNDLRVDSLVVEKKKTGNALQNPKRFYPEMLGYLLSYVIEKVDGNHIDEIIVITDSIPLSRKKKTIEKSIKQTLANTLPVDCSYKILHHSSKSHFGLQIADYCNWAILRKWERADTEFYSEIHSCIKSEFEIFKGGRKYYY